MSKVYNKNNVNLFPEQFTMELPNGYRIDTEYDDDFNEVYHLRGGFYINDDGDEDFAFTAGFITLNVDQKENPNATKQDRENLRNPLHPDYAFNQVMDSVMESTEDKFGSGKCLKLYNSQPFSAIMKFYQPFNLFGFTLDTYLIFYWVEVTENKVFGFTSTHRSDPSESAEYYKHLLKVIKSVRVNGKPIDTGKITPKKLEKALDLDADENVKPMDLGLSVGINIQDGDEESHFTLNSDGSITSEEGSNGMAYAVPDESLYPHYNSMLRTQGFGMLGVNVVVNQTGTEYKFYNLSEELDEDASEEMRDAISQLKDTGAADYKLADKSKEMTSLFHVTPDAFDSAHDRECELKEGYMHRAYMMSALRSFAWTLSKYCQAMDKKPADLSLDQIQSIIDTVSDENWLNYDNKSVCKGLCGTQDLHVFYLPDNTPESVKQFFRPSQEMLDETKQMQEKFPNYNPILQEVGSLDELRKDLEYIYPAIEKIYADLKKDRNYNEPLTGNDADILYAWCALAYAARGPFFSEDGPTMCLFMQELTEEEQIEEHKARRKQMRDKWLATNQKYLESNPLVEFKDKKFVFTGFAYRAWELKEEIDYRSMIEERGGLVRSKVSGVTDYLVVDPAGAGESKLTNAVEQQKNGKPVHIILIDDLRKALGLPDDESKVTAIAEEEQEAVSAPAPAEGTAVVDDRWEVLIPEGFKYCTDKNIIGGHRNIIIMEDDPDNDFEDPFSATISFTSMFTKSENAPGPQMAEMVTRFMSDNNKVEVVRNDEDLYAAYYFSASHKEDGEKLDIFKIEIGYDDETSSIQVFFNNSDLSRREQSNLVKRVTESIKLVKPGEAASGMGTPVRDIKTADRPSVPMMGNRSMQSQRNLGVWGFTAVEVPESRKKLIDNKYGYPIRILPHSETQKNWEHDMAQFKYCCHKRNPAYPEQVRTLLDHAEQYMSLFSEDGVDTDIREGKLKSSAPLHALRSFIWTATELQGNKVKSSFPSDVPTDMWIDLAQFIAIHDNANYSPVAKRVKRFGAAFLKKEEVRSIYTSGIGYSNPQWMYQDEALGKTMNNASISDLFQVVENLLEIMPVMDAYYDVMKDDAIDEQTAETMGLILQGWSAFAFASRQPFFIVPGDFVKSEPDFLAVPTWAEEPVIRDIEDGKFTLCENEILSIQENSNYLSIPEGVTGIILHENNIPSLRNSFRSTRIIVYPRSFTGPIVVPPNVREIEVLGDPEVLRTCKLSTEESSKLERLEFKGSPKSVAEKAFAGLDSLKNLELPEGIEKLYNNAFNGFKPKKITLPESLNQIGEEVFKQYCIDRYVTINAYADCAALSEIRSQLKQHKDYIEDWNKRAYSASDIQNYNIKLNVHESPWESRARSFAVQLAELYKKQSPGYVDANLVSGILKDTIGDEEDFAKCSKYLITQSLMRGLRTLNDILKSSSDTQQVYSRLPGELSEDIKQSIEARNKEEQERKIKEVNALLTAPTLSGLNKALTLLNELKADGAVVDTLIQECSTKLGRLKAEQYAKAVVLSQKSDEESIKSAIQTMTEIDPYEDSAVKIEAFEKLLKQEQNYSKAVAAMDTSDINELLGAMDLFRSLGDYKESSARVSECSQKIDELRESMYQEAREAEKVYSLKSQSDAQTKYETLAGYKDASERKDKCSSNIQIIREILDCNKGIEDDKKELAGLTGIFKKKDRQAKEEEIRQKEQHVAELKSELTKRSVPEEVKHTIEQEKTADDLSAEFEVTKSPEGTAYAPSVPSVAAATNNSMPTAPSQMPKKKSKVGIVIAVLIIIALAIAGLFMSGVLDNFGNQPEDSYVEEEENIQEVTPEFTEANVLTIEEIDQEIIEYDNGDGLNVYYKVTNNSDNEIWSLSFDTYYYDESGNMIYENGGTYSGRLEPGKFAYVTDSPNLDGKDPSIVKDIEVRSYTYAVGNQWYSIDLKTNAFDSSSGAIDGNKNVDYSEADVLSFDILDDKLSQNEYGDSVIKVKVTNNGDEVYNQIGIGMEFYDSDGNSVYINNSSYEGLAPKQSMTVEIPAYEQSDKVDSFEIVNYDYELSQKDEKGYNNYSLNTVTESAYGYEL